MLSELIKTRIAKIFAFEKDLKLLFEKIIAIFAQNENPFVQKIKSGLEHLNTLSTIKVTTDTIPSLVSVVKSVNQLDALLAIINKTLVQLLDKKVNVETFLSQTFINETREYHAKVQHLFAKLKAELSESYEKILEVVKESIIKLIVSNTEKNFDIFVKATIPLCVELFNRVTNTLLDSIEDPALTAAILKKVEVAKNNILIGEKPEKFKYKNINPFFKSYGLVSVSEICDITTLAKVVFPNNVSLIKTEKEFVALCHANNYEVVICTKHLGRGISYNVLPLLNLEESKSFGTRHSDGDGVSQEFVDRFHTIEYIGKKSVKWNIDFEHFELKYAKFVIVICSPYPGLYGVISNKIDPPQHFMRKAMVEPFLEFIKNTAIKNTYVSTRVGKYNEMSGKEIVNKMFLSVKPDLDSLKIKAQVIDPKYLRNEVYVLILAKFRELFAKDEPQNAYEFSKLVHSKEFESIFNHVVMNEYHKYLFRNTSIYEVENISMSEVYASFLYTMNIYERDFKKRLHDTFLLAMPKNEVFKDPSRSRLLDEIFDDILKKTLQKIITNENNIFQSILYKLYIFKLSLID